MGCLCSAKHTLGTRRARRTVYANKSSDSAAEGAEGEVDWGFESEWLRSRRLRDGGRRPLKPRFNKSDDGRDGYKLNAVAVAGQSDRFPSGEIEKDDNGRITLLGEPAGRVFVVDIVAMPVMMRPIEVDMKSGVGDMIAILRLVVRMTNHGQQCLRENQSHDKEQVQGTAIKNSRCQTRLLSRRQPVVQTVQVYDFAMHVENLNAARMN
jgi:hypothetical protein